MNEFLEHVIKYLWIFDVWALIIFLVLGFKTKPINSSLLTVARSTEQPRMGVPECLKSAQAKKPSVGIVVLFQAWMMPHERFLAIPGGRV